MEASSHASALGRLDGTRFAALVFTNLSQDHLDFHGTMEEYFEAKRRLFWEPWPAAVNVGDEYGRRLADELRGGRRQPADLRLRRRRRPAPRRARADPAGARFRAGGLDVTTRLRGRFNVENVLGTVAAARLLGLEDAAVAGGIASVRGVPGRFESVDEGQPFAVIVDYAHKPDALENVLRSARELATGRVICVFGCGGDRDRGKRPLMGRIASALSRRRDRHLGQSAQRGSARDHRGDPRRGARGRGRARPRRRDRSRDRARRRGRRRRDRRQGPRAGTGARRPHGPVRRQGGGARGAARLEAPA